ncbi:MAG TPA: hypothetical protein VFV56_04125 [Gaiellaceae bacterium]|jgi:hypothetical protein|nr:hypothetical protein [Gaiellaceae bacterium]
MRREVTWREAFFAGGGGALLAVVMTWPLVLHLGSDIGKDLGDPLLQAWQVAWIGHALLHAPLHLWQANTFWPYDDTLAFSDALIGYAPVGVLSQSSPHAALVGYNLLFLFAYALAFLGAYLLAREIGIGWPGAIAAGAAFAYAPWRLAQNGHLHVLSSGGIPLAIFLLVRGYRRRSAPTVLAGWLVAAWQMTLGFTLGLQLAYLLLVLGVIAGVAFWRSWLPRPDRRVLVASLLGIAAFVLVSGLMARPYLRVLDAHPEARRSVEYVQTFSPRARSFLAGPVESHPWARVTARARASLEAPDEMALFPGLTISLLALAGVLGSVLPRRLRIGLAVGVVVCALLSLGVRDVDGLHRYLTPYRFLFDFGPGWDGVRTPGRINTLTSLGIALLAGAGLCVATGYLRARRGVRFGRLAAGALIALVLFDGLGPIAHPRVPTPPAAVSVAPEPQLSLPAGFLDDLRYSYWSTAGFPLTVNGAGGFDPTGYDRLRHAVAGFPDEASIAALEKAGIRSVVLYPGAAEGTTWERAASKPVAGLPVERERVGDAIVFRLR